MKTFSLINKSLFKSELIKDILLSLLCIHSFAHSRVIEAPSGYYTEIQNAVNEAIPGDVVLIPSGTWYISQTVYLKEGIHIKGTGKDSTILCRSFNPNVANKNPIFILNTISGKPFRISDIGFKGVADFLTAVFDEDRGIVIYGKATDFIIHDCRFTRFAGVGIYLCGMSLASLLGHPKGLICNNEFIDNYFTGCTGYGIQLLGDDSWPVELQLGSPDAVYIEANYFTKNRHCIAAIGGARYVFRYNTSVDHYYPWAVIDAHGAYDPSIGCGEHGTRSYESYNNQITGGIETDGTPHPTWAAGIRGGDGVIFSNEFFGLNNNMFLFIENFYGLINPTYPVHCQTTNLWLWGNTADGIPVNNINIGITSTDLINLSPFLQENRDFHFIQKAEYTPYTYPHPMGRLSGFYSLDDSVNDYTIDSSCNGNDGNIYGDIVFVPGKIGNAFDFSGNNDFIDCGNPQSLNITGGITVSAWIYAESGYVEGVSSQRVIGSKYKWAEGGTGKGWLLASSWNGNTLSFTIYNGTGIHGYTSVTDFFSSGYGLGKWKHVAGVFKPGQYIKLYVDGLCVSTDNSSIPLSIPYYSDTPTIIGKRSDGNYYFDGKIDDFKIFSCALESDDIQKLYNMAGDGSFEKGIDGNGDWFVKSGTPEIDSAVPFDGINCINFYKPLSTQSSVLIKLSDYIPVKAGEYYTTSAWAKGQNIISGIESWYRFMTEGKWYDKNMNVISSFNLIFPLNTYDWTFCSNISMAPANACYYRVTWVGMCGSSTGEAWIDKFYFQEK